MSRPRTTPGSDRPVAQEIRRVLVVYKKSTYQTQVLERKNERYLELVRSGHESVTRLELAHREHLETLEETRAALAHLGCESVFRFRGDESLIEDFDLVVTVGGDGTLLWVARWMSGSVPIIALNSAPGHSVGHFCAGKKGRVEPVLEAALEGRLSDTSLTRMDVRLDGKVLSKRVLNDALYAHASPAATSRYVLRLRPPGRAVTQSEEQRSSGLWIGPSAGSTAAQRSAGGRVLPPDSTAIQYVVREPYVPEGETLTMRVGEVEEGGAVEIVSKSSQAHLFLDGPHHKVAVPLGATVRLSASDEPLRLLGYPRAR